MLQRFIVAAAFCLLAVLEPAHALGLGEIKVSSKLNQRFSAVIPFTSLSADEAANVRARLADNRAFERAGVERSSYLSSVDIEVVTEGGNPRIELRSGDLAREPLLSLMIEVSTPGGPRILREYTVFLDPAVLPPPPPVAKPQALPDPVTAAAAPSEFFQTPEEAGAGRTAPAAASGDPSRYTVAAGDTLWMVAQAVKPAGAGRDQVMLALFEANPAAFINGDIDALRKGVTLKVPGAEQMQTRSNAAARARVNELSAQTSGAAPVTAAPASPPIPDPALTSEAPVPAAPPAGASELPPNAPVTAPVGPEAATAPAVPATPPAGEPATAVPTPEAAAAPPVVAPVAEPAPAAVAEPAGEGWLDKLLPILIGLLALLIAVVVFRAMRERKAQREYEDASRSTASLPPVRAVAAGASARKSARAELEELDRKIEERADDDATRVAAAEDDRTRLDAETTGPYPRYMGDPPPAPAPRKPDKAEMEVTSRFQATTTEIDLDDNDPMSEADFHLAYGLYDEAALMLLQASAKDPGRTELKVKLAETYFAAGKPREFEQTAAQLRGKLGAEGWGKIAIMGRQLCPDAALFADASGESELALDMAFDDEAGIAPVAVDKGLEFSLEELELPSQSGRDIAAKDNSTLEFDLGEFDLSDTKTKPGLQSTNEVNLKDFDLGGSDLAGPGKSDFDVRLDEVEPLLLLDDDSGNDTVIGGDDAGTKLDLARAYVEMGDAKMARSLLEEVEKSGNAEQKREAASLRERLLG